MYSGMFDVKEARRLKKLEHPNIIKCFVVEERADFIYLALELCEKTLTKCVQDNDFGRQDNGVERLGCLKDITRAVVYLHQVHGICHRDIKPENILLSASSPKKFILADFNTARQTGSTESASTQYGSIVGTNGYIAPEVYEPSERVNVRMDIFSLGCVFYYTLTDKGHPFGSVKPKKCQANIKSKQKPLLIDNAFLDCSWTKPMIEDMVSYHAEQRPTAEVVMKALEVLYSCNLRNNSLVSFLSSYITGQEFVCTVYVSCLY